VSKKSEMAAARQRAEAAAYERGKSDAQAAIGRALVRQLAEAQRVAKAAQADLTKSAPERSPAAVRQARYRAGLNAERQQYRDYLHKLAGSASADGRAAAELLENEILEDLAEGTS